MYSGEADRRKNRDLGVVVVHSVILSSSHRHCVFLLLSEETKKVFVYKVRRCRVTLTLHQCNPKLNFLKPGAARRWSGGEKSTPLSVLICCSDRGLTHTAGVASVQSRPFLLDAAKSGAGIKTSAAELTLFFAVGQLSDTPTRGLKQKARTQTNWQNHTTSSNKQNVTVMFRYKCVIVAGRWASV